jgi:hypothetical protein
MNVRLEENLYEDLKRYIAYAGGGDFSYFISEGLRKVFKEDTGFPAWLANHPGPIPEARKKKGQTKPSQQAKAPARRDGFASTPTHIAVGEATPPAGGAHVEAVS